MQGEVKEKVKNADGQGWITPKEELENVRFVLSHFGKHTIGKAEEDALKEREKQLAKIVL